MRDEIERALDTLARELEQNAPAIAAVMDEATATRERCIKCGMTANVDPSLHTERYGHKPAVFRDGEVWEFDFQTYAFTTWIGDGNAETRHGR